MSSTHVERGPSARTSLLKRLLWSVIGVCCPIGGACLAFVNLLVSEPDAEPLELVASLGVVVLICLTVSIGCLVLLEARAKVRAFSVVAAAASLAASYGTLICIVLMFVVWDSSGEMRMWLPVMMLFGVPLVLPIVLSAHLGAAIIVRGALGREEGLKRAVRWQ
jgi:hypothetical protein